MTTAEQPEVPRVDLLEPRSAKGRRTRARLVEAAKRVFEERGLTGARVSDITAEAKASYGLFYHYFKSKEEVFCEVAEAQEVSLLSALEDAAGHGWDPVERIRAANRTYLSAYRRERKIMAVIESVSRYDETVRQVRAPRDDQFALRLQTSIESLQRSGRADPNIDPWYAANALGYMVARFAEDWLVHGVEYEFEKAVDQLTRLWANAIGLPPDGSPEVASDRPAAAAPTPLRARRPRRRPASPAPGS